MLPEGWRIHDLAVSGDGQRIAFSANNLVEEESEGGIYVLNLHDRSVVEVYTGTGAFRDIDWSSDGGYVVYIRGESSDEGYYNNIEALHIDSRVVSQLVDGLVELGAAEDSVEYYASRPAWSPGGDRILYLAFREYYASWPDITGHVVSITCDQQAHQCQVRNASELDWAQYRVQLFWADGGSLIISVSVTGAENLVTIERRDTSGTLYDATTLDGESLGIAQSATFALSSDGHFLAINPYGGRFYLLDLNTEELLDLSGTHLADAPQFDWMP